MHLHVKTLCLRRIIHCPQFRPQHMTSLVLYILYTVCIFITWCLMVSLALFFHTSTTYSFHYVCSSLFLWSNLCSISKPILVYCHLLHCHNRHNIKMYRNKNCCSLMNVTRSYIWYGFLIGETDLLSTCKVHCVPHSEKRNCLSRCQPNVAFR